MLQQQNTFDDLIVVIPSRIGSVRLENKALAIIEGMTMIERVCLQVKKTRLKNIFVATDSSEIYSAAIRAGCDAVMTGTNCATGTDRVYECYKKIQQDHKFQKIKYIINVQGDMPFVDPETILSVARLIKTDKFDIATPVVRTSRENAEGNSNVKVVSNGFESFSISDIEVIDRSKDDSQATAVVNRVNNQANKNNDDRAKKIEFSSAIYFSRSMIPSNAEEFLYHVGIYGFTSDSLEKFCNLEQSYLEKTENLEQLRALENSMSIGICYVKDIPISVDTKEDLEKAIERCKNFPL